VIEACRGVADAHRRGIVHRDLKPANLFLARERGRRIVKVLDFGISHMDQPDELRVTQTHTAFGTPLYMSPEAVRSAKLTDARTDVWALGVILYELVVGRPPFLGESATAVAVAVSVEGFVPASELVAEIPTGFDAIVGAALEKSPANRYADASALGRALEALLGGRAVGAPAPPAALPDASPSDGRASSREVAAPAVSPALEKRPRGARAALLLVASVVLGAALSLGLAALALRRPHDAAHDAASAAAPPSPEATEAVATGAAPADESDGAPTAAPTALAASPSSEPAAPTRVASGSVPRATASTSAPAPLPRPSSTAPTTTAPTAPPPTATGARPSQGTPPLHL
jgi:serine/threonine-protein kinase